MDIGKSGSEQPAKLTHKIFWALLLESKIKYIEEMAFFNIYPTC